MSLKELRISKKLTQAQSAKYLGMPLRTYQNYENDESKKTSMKYLYMIDKLEKYGYIDETTGIISVEQIKEACAEVFKNLDVDYCYLFGSYAEGNANESSDVDLLISTSITGLDYFSLIETLRSKLFDKKIDLLTVKQLEDNFPLLNEILKKGVKIYG
ncbi:MAG: Nucleotidyltransferase domain protein [Tenericutes bacterium ADurb.Bin087]|nr:MAG: Nucleotidyltransferase domain protein [Tenericutes bacterium ADurb.Bin087]